MISLDGTYRLEQVATLDKKPDNRGVNEIEIKDNQSYYTDNYGCKWRTSFTFEDDSHVKMVAVADQSDINLDNALAGASGHTTGEAVTYETLLKLSQKGEQVHLSGEIGIGDKIVLITLHKIN